MASLGNTATNVASIADVQSSKDLRNLAIDLVGIKGARHPILVADEDENEQSTIAEFDMYVDLPPNIKGTHMSRFIEILNGQDSALSLHSFKSLLKQMTARLGATTGVIRVSFPFFIRKYAPISRVQSLMDYQVTFNGRLAPDSTSVELEIVIPVTSLCPCSKEISDYGAHNQRSHVTLKVEARNSVTITKMVQLVEQEASCELFGTLKRPDEKYVTERAYENPKFVEDLVRDIAARLNDDHDICRFSVAAENFESIHNHSAYAVITKDQ